jgi:hypothetical protein
MVRNVYPSQLEDRAHLYAPGYGGRPASFKTGIGPKPDVPINGDIDFSKKTSPRGEYELYGRGLSELQSIDKEYFRMVVGVLRYVQKKVKKLLTPELPTEIVFPHTVTKNTK